MIKPALSFFLLTLAGCVQITVTDPPEEGHVCIGYIVSDYGFIVFEECVNWNPFTEPLYENLKPKPAPKRKEWDL